MKYLLKIAIQNEIQKLTTYTTGKNWKKLSLISRIAKLKHTSEIDAESVLVSLHNNNNNSMTTIIRPPNMMPKIPPITDNPYIFVHNLLHSSNNKSPNMNNINNINTQNNITKHNKSIEKGSTIDLLIDGFLRNEMNNFPIDISSICQQFISDISNISI
eukprot:248946_1